MGMLGTWSLCRANGDRKELQYLLEQNTLPEKSNQNMLDYLLDVEQQHSLLGQIFGKNLEAEQHVGGGDRVQGVGRQEHALEAVLPHLRENPTFSLIYNTSVTV